MRLYTIRRKSDGKYLRKINGHYQLVSGRTREEANEWSVGIAYLLKTADGVRSNILKLCSEPYWDTKAPDGVLPAIAKTWKAVGWRNFDRSLADLYEVVSMDVTVNSQDYLPCHHFLKVSE